MAVGPAPCSHPAQALPLRSLPSPAMPAVFALLTATQKSSQHPNYHCTCVHVVFLTCTCCNYSTNETGFPGHGFVLWQQFFFLNQYYHIKIFFGCYLGFPENGIFFWICFPSSIAAFLKRMSFFYQHLIWNSVTKCPGKRVHDTHTHTEGPDYSRTLQRPSFTCLEIYVQSLGMHVPSQVWG